MKPSRVYKDHSNGSGPSTKVGHIQRLKWRGGRQIKTCNCMLNLLACWENLRISLLFKQPSHYLSLQGDNQCMKRASDQRQSRESYKAQSVSTRMERGRENGEERENKREMWGLYEVFFMPQKNNPNSDLSVPERVNRSLWPAGGSKTNNKTQHWYTKPRP